MQDAFHRALRTRLNELIALRSGQVSSGMASTFDDYKSRCGYIQALNDVVTLGDEIEKKLYGDNPLKGE